MLETPRANLSAAAGWLQTTYTIRFNRRHRRSGHLFQGCFKAHLVEADAYALELIKYIHLNPVRPKDKRKRIPADRKRELSRYKWSSHRVYVGIIKESSAPLWLCLDWLSYFGRTNRAAKTEYGRQIERMFGHVARSPWDHLRGGLVLGGDKVWRKACRLISGSTGDDQIRWGKRADRDTVSRRVHRLVEREQDRRIKMWLLVRLGGQRMTDVAKSYWIPIPHWCSSSDQTPGRKGEERPRVCRLSTRFKAEA